MAQRMVLVTESMLRYLQTGCMDQLQQQQQQQQQTGMHAAITGPATMTTPATANPVAGTMASTTTPLQRMGLEEEEEEEEDQEQGDSGVGGGHARPMMGPSGGPVEGEEEEEREEEEEKEEEEDDVEPETAGADALNSAPTNQGGKVATMAHLARLANLMPMDRRTKALRIFSRLQGTLKLDDQNRVLYPPNDVPGSNVYDLVSFFLTPANIPRPRPVDAPRFGQLLLRQKVPLSLIGKGRYVAKAAASQLHATAAAAADATGPPRKRRPGRPRKKQLHHPQPSQQPSSQGSMNSKNSNKRINNMKNGKTATETTARKGKELAVTQRKISWMSL